MNFCCIFIYIIFKVYWQMKDKGNFKLVDRSTRTRFRQKKTTMLDIKNCKIFNKTYFKKSMFKTIIKNVFFLTFGVSISLHISLTYRSKKHITDLGVVKMAEFNTREI